MESIPAKLLDEWQAFWTLEPFGGFEAEYQMGMLASVIANTQRDVKKKTQPFKATEFMRECYTDELKPQGEGLLEKISNVFGALGGGRLPET